MFQVITVDRERWIFISADFSTEDPNSFIKLVKEYQSQCDGKVCKVSDNTQYSIDCDPLNLIFQWDSCFGITVVVPHRTDIAIAEKTLKDLCDKLNMKYPEKKS